MHQNITLKVKYNSLEPQIQLGLVKIWGFQIDVVATETAWKSESVYASHWPKAQRQPVGTLSLAGNIKYARTALVLDMALTLTIVRSKYLRLCKPGQPLSCGWMRLVNRGRQAI